MSDLFEFVPFDKWIPKEDLEIGARYLCKARNFTEGTWNGETFDYMRTKWGMTSPDREFHWDDGPPCGTVKPLRKLENSDG